MLKENLSKSLEVGNIVIQTLVIYNARLYD